MEGKKSNSLPSIFEYTDYRRFLADYYQSAKASHRGFSFRSFSMMAGFTSPNFLKLVIQGKRNLSELSTRSFARALKLGKNEAHFFSHLVQMNQAKSHDVKQHHASKMQASRTFQKFHPLKADEFHYYCQWFWIPVRELIGLVEFREDPEWVAAQLFPPIKDYEAKEALEGLQRLGLIRRNSAGFLEQTNSIVIAADDIMVTSVREFHRTMLKKAAESIESVPAKEREIASASVGLSANGALKVKALLRKTREKILAIADAEAEPNRVYQVGLQLFPLSKSGRRGST